MKKEARLTGALLARKGQAAPSLATPKLSVPAIDRFGNHSISGEHYSPASDPVPEIVNVPAGEDTAPSPSPSFSPARPVETAQVSEDAAPREDSPLETAMRTAENPAEVQKTAGHNLPQTRSVAPTPVSGSTPSKARERAVVARSVPKGEEKRIAMTLRMDKDSHLKLRLYTAHSRKSCQEVLMEALDMYFQENCCMHDEENCTCVAG